MRTSSLVSVLALTPFTLAIPSPVTENGVSSFRIDTSILKPWHPALKVLSERPATPYLFTIDDEVPLFISFTRYGRLIQGAYGSLFMARFINELRQAVRAAGGPHAKVTPQTWEMSHCRFTLRSDVGAGSIEIGDLLKWAIGLSRFMRLYG